MFFLFFLDLFWSTVRTYSIYMLRSKPQKEFAKKKKKKNEWIYRSSGGGRASILHHSLPRVSARTENQYIERWELCREMCRIGGVRCALYAHSRWLTRRAPSFQPLHPTQIHHFPLSLVNSRSQSNRICQTIYAAVVCSLSFPLYMLALYTFRTVSLLPPGAPKVISFFF